MRILDERGRLFGKINIVDFFILLLILIIIPVFFHIYRILGKDPSRIPHAPIIVEAVTFIVPDFADNIKEGDIAYDQHGKPQGRILRILDKNSERGKRLKEAIMNTFGDDGRIRKSDMSLFLEMELLCTKSGKNEVWYYDRAPISVSLESTFKFITDKYKIACYLISFKD